MGNVYNRNQNLHINHHKGSIFLPMLCSKPSVVKDAVRLPKWKDDKSSDDPLSPKISCMGQVKRNNKIVGFPALDITTKINRCNTSTTTNNIKYFKLKKLFSSNSSRRKQGLVSGLSSSSSSINIENMDPPLPVIEKVAKQESACIHGDTLWQRRFRGVSLGNLELQQIQLNRHQEPQYKFERHRTMVDASQDVYELLVKVQRLGH